MPSLVTGKRLSNFSTDRKRISATNRVYGRAAYKHALKVKVKGGRSKSLLSELAEFRRQTRNAIDSVSGRVVDPIDDFIANVDVPDLKVRHQSSVNRFIGSVKVPPLSVRPMYVRGTYVQGPFRAPFQKPIYHRKTFKSPDGKFEDFFPLTRDELNDHYVDDYIKNYKFPSKDEMADRAIDNFISSYQFPKKKKEISYYHDEPGLYIPGIVHQPYKVDESRSKYIARRKTGFRRSRDIQRVWRGSMARDKLIKSWHASAKIQRLFRGSRVRRNYRQTGFYF